MSQRYTMNVVVLGLEDELSSQVQSALSRSGTAVQTKPAKSAEECIHSLNADSGDVVVCGPDLDNVKLLRQQCPSAAIIVLSRAAEVSDWLDAIEAGADDYYAAPLDGAQVRWMIESMRTRRTAA
jgi:DNA-binding response OmpR family regulator